MNCKNCKTPLESSFKFCHECGAKIIHNRLTLKSVIHNIGEQFFNYDNKIFKTFAHLFTKPEVVIVGYINGVRKKYLNVIQYFAIALTITGLLFFILNTFFDNPFQLNAKKFGIPDNLPNQNSINSIFEDISNLMNKYFNLLYVISLPISAFGSWFTYKIYVKKFNFTEHLIINTYYSAQLLSFLAVLAVICACFGISYMDFSFYSLPIAFVYFWFILKRIYEQSIFDSLLYLFIYLCIYFLVLGIMSFFTGIVIGILFS